MKPGVISNTIRAMRYWEQKQRVMAHNLANTSTHGFKGERVFARLLDGAGPTPSATTDFEGGALTQTEGPLDVALEGDGFLVVKTPEGLRLTRGGALSIDGSARLVDAAGNPVLGDQGEILLPPGDVQINRDGVISVDGTPEATLRVVDIEDPAQLLRGEGLLFATDAELVSAGGVTVHQGYLEESNVEPISSLVEMIEIQRVYASLQKASEALDRVQGTIANELSRLE